jgi:Flp pilus assembly CpaF family ATPase
MNPDDELKHTWERFRRDADAGREPQLIAGRSGRRQVSFGALLERIEREFIEEYADSPALQEAVTAAQRLRLVLATVDYVLSVESVTMAAADKAELIQAAYSGLFGYGPLDNLLLDERITTIVLEGADRVSVRYGHADLTSLGPLFEDEQHLKRILRRLLQDAGADLYADQPFIETGLRVNGRPVCISLVMPPLTFGYQADIRLHAAQPPALTDLIQSGFLTDTAAEVLRALAASSHGFVIVGDTESGKTTLLSALAHLLPEPERTIAVERAGELHLPEGVERLVVRWATDTASARSFGAQIGTALARQPKCILLDEVRSDEPTAIAPLLQDEAAPRQIWSFRGPFDVKRLRNALSMLARRADMQQSEMMVQALYQRLPFVITVWRVNGQLRLYSIGEWQYRDSDYPDFVLLAENREGQLRLTGQPPAHPLDLPATFWQRQ